MKDFKPIRDNIKRLIRKHGFKYLTFSEDYLNVKYNTFDRHLRYGRIQLKHVYIMMELLNCDFYRLTGESASTSQDIKTDPTNTEEIPDTKYVYKDEAGHSRTNINEGIATEDEPQEANLDFLSNKV